MDYLENYRKAQVNNPDVAQNRANLIKFYAPRYLPVAETVGIPWQIIGCIHSLESACLMNRHLHNGDPLNGRTVHVPKGRPVKDPKSGKFPYSWEESAIDALTNRIPPDSKTLAGWLLWCERYNGMGYALKKLPSPYLWAGTDVYEKGYYTSDGVFNPGLVSKQIGVVPLLRCLGVTNDLLFIT